LEKKLGFIYDWDRRFWMASQDHRGTPQHPGRVLTIKPMVGARCFGVAYLIKPETLLPLDHREQNGYLRKSLNFTTALGDTFKAITYIGDQAAPVYQAEKPTENCRISV